MSIVNPEMMDNTFLLLIKGTATVFYMLKVKINGLSVKMSVCQLLPDRSEIIYQPGYKESRRWTA